MAAPTSDERREVAKEIRKYVDAYGDKIEDAEMVLLGTVWRRGEFNEVVRPTSAVELLAMVADLIDPTCHIVCVDDTYNTPETGRVDEWHYECGKCGIELDDNDTDAMDSGAKPFDYCPNCGCRVVSDDD